jgi:hypothetical protein
VAPASGTATVNFVLLHPAPLDAAATSVATAESPGGPELLLLLLPAVFGSITVGASAVLCFLAGVGYRLSEIRGL